MVGKNEDKYLSAEKGAIGGWKVYTVKTVDMERNRVYINDYSVRFPVLSGDMSSCWEASMADVIVEAAGCRLRAGTEWIMAGQRILLCVYRKASAPEQGRRQTNGRTGGIVTAMSTV